MKTEFDRKHLTEWLAIKAENLSHWIAAAILIEFAFIGVVKARYRTMWLDEIMGSFIIRLPSRSQIWTICQSGADNQPPFYHYLMRASMSLFGGSDILGMRIPSVLGFCLCCFCLYWFVSRNVSKLYGIVAMLYPALTLAWVYGTEGRPYALLLGLASLAAVCWQAVNRGRRIMAVGLWLTLLLALNCHYYAVLMLVPLGIAESVRTYIRKKIDFFVWLALTTPPLTLLVYIPVLRVSKTNSGIPYAPFTNPALYYAFWRYNGEFLGSSLIFLIFLGAVYLAVRTFSLDSGGAVLGWFRSGNRAQLLPEVSLVLGFTSMPVFVILFSKFATHIFFPRYAITGIFGFAALIGLSAGLAFWDKKGPALALVVMSSILVFYYQGHEDVPLITSARNTPQTISVPHRLPQSVLDGNLPIVPTDLDDFMKFNYYGDSALRKRLFYVSSEKLAEQYLGFTFHERMMLGAAPYFHTQVVDYDAFIHEHPTFYVFGSLRFSQWVVPKLMADGAELKLIQGGPSGGGYLDECFLAKVTRN